SLLQCSAAPAHIGDCDYETQAYYEIGAETTLTADITLSAVISTDSGTVDCRTAGACTLAVTHDSLRSPEKAALAPLEFDPTTEVVPPTLTVEPSTALVDGRTVTVTGSGVTPGWMAFYACTPALAGEYEECVWLETDVQADSAGTVAVDLEVPAIIPTYTGEVDCRTTAQPCQLVGTRYSTSSARAGRADLHFDPDGPVAPGPAITVEPGDDLPDEATVTVSGSSFSVQSESAPVQVCEVGTDRCDDQTRSRAPIDNDGRFAIELGV